ncbi:hypothetical protein [Sorangium sp. So ce1078]
MTLAPSPYGVLGPLDVPLGLGLLRQALGAKYMTAEELFPGE